jgi:hypothetical protein
VEQPCSSVLVSAFVAVVVAVEPHAQIRSKAVLCPRDAGHSKDQPQQSPSWEKGDLLALLIALLSGDFPLAADALEGVDVPLPSSHSISAPLSPTFVFE